MRTKLPKSIVAGDLDIGDITIACAVLEDGIRVVSQSGVNKALGRSKPSRKKTTVKMPPFLALKVLKPFINKELEPPLLEPIEYLAPNGSQALGLKAELLPKVCSVWVKAEKAGALSERQKRVAERAYILLEGFAHVGIIALVDEATGYQELRSKKALANILEKFISEELQKWTRTFPLEFYEQIFRLRKWDFDALPDGKKPPTPSVVGRFTNQIVYERLAPGVLNELKKRNPVLPSGHRKAKHHQWFTPDSGHPKLKEHLAGVIALMKASNTWEKFERSLKRAYPKTEDQLEILD